MSSQASSEAPNKISKLQQRMVKWGAVLLVAVVALFGIYELGRQANKWGEPDELRIIKAEKMVKDDLLGLELVKTRVDGEGDLISKTVSPSISRSFRVDDGQAESVRMQLIRLAEEDGWVHDSSIISDAWWGRKTVKDLELVITIEKSLVDKNLIEVSIF